MMRLPTTRRVDARIVDITVEPPAITLDIDGESQICHATPKHVARAQAFTDGQVVAMLLRYPSGTTQLLWIRDPAAKPDPVTAEERTRRLQADWAVTLARLARE